MKMTGIHVLHCRKDIFVYWNIGYYGQTHCSHCAVCFTMLRISMLRALNSRVRCSNAVI